MTPQTPATGEGWTAPENPAAFPCTGEGFSNPYYTQHGMSLRDWFAGQALGYLGQRKNIAIRGAEHIASIAFELADAMLAARVQS